MANVPYNPRNTFLAWLKAGEQVISPTGRFTLRRVKTGRSKPVSSIVSSGMGGFSEAGEPGNWDMALGEIYGYRWWKMEVPSTLVGYGNGYNPRPVEPQFFESKLIGANARSWNNGKNEAVCTSGSSHSIATWDDLIEGVKPLVHEPPEYRAKCGCGFWAYFDKNLDVTNVLGGMQGPTPDMAWGRMTAWIPVLGVVKGTGRVIIGTKGFRSQYAEIIGLCVSDRAKELLGYDIGQGYGYQRNSSHVARGFGGPPGYYSYDYESSYADHVRQAHTTERLRRFAFIEAALSNGYPDAKVFSDQMNMVKYFPPDKNYAPKPKGRDSFGNKYF